MENFVELLSSKPVHLGDKNMTSFTYELIQNLKSLIIALKISWNWLKITKLSSRSAFIRFPPDKDESVDLKESLLIVMWLICTFKLQIILIKSIFSYNLFSLTTLEHALLLITFEELQLVLRYWFATVQRLLHDKFLIFLILNLH